MDCCNTGKMLPFEEAKQRLKGSIERTTKTEVLALDYCLDKVLAADAISTIQVPNYDNSAMDGYALRSQDFASTSQFHLIGKSFAGAPYSGKVESGQCVRIMTGAVIPAGADTVIMQENSSAQGDTTIGELIEFSQPAKANENIRRAGEDIRIGDVILKQGSRISPVDLGLLASIGIASVEVYQAIKVALFSSGDELRLPSETLTPGCIYESNRFVVRAMLQRLGADVVDLGIIPDDPVLLERAFTQASDTCDAVISSGGVSVGEADYTKSILDKLGQVDFWKVAMKPGKPFAFGTLNTNGPKEVCYFFGLPGNPVSATVTFHQLALPALRKLAGEIFNDEINLPLSTLDTLKKSPGRADFQRGLLTRNDKDELCVTSTGSQGSGILTSISKADCYIVLEAEENTQKKGSTVMVQPFDRWLSR